MRIEKTLPLSGGPVIVRELTVGDLRAWLADSGRYEAGSFIRTVFDDLLLTPLLGPDLLPADVARFSDFDATKIDGYSPSEIALIANTIREVNGAFFVVQAGLARMQPPPSTASNAPAAPLPGPDTAPGSGLTPTEPS